MLIRVPYYLALTRETGKFGTYLYDVTVDGWVNSKSKLKKEEWAYIAVTSVIRICSRRGGITMSVEKNKAIVLEYKDENGRYAAHL